MSLTKTTKILNALNQEATIWVANLAKVGISIFSVTGTTNVFSFLGSVDGITFFPISVGAYPAPLSVGASGNLPGTPVQTASAAGTWETNVSNLNFVRVQLTTGVGPASVTLAASTDGAYQEAFLLPTQIGVSSSVVYPSTTSTASDTNTMTVPAQANRTINLTFLEVSLVGAGFGGNAQLRIWDGAVGSGVPLFSDFLTPPVGSVGTVQKINLPTDPNGAIGIQGSPGNALVIQIRNLGNTSSVINGRVSFL